MNAILIFPEASETYEVPVVDVAGVTFADSTLDDQVGVTRTVAPVTFVPLVVPEARVEFKLTVSVPLFVVKGRTYVVDESTLKRATSPAVAVAIPAVVTYATAPVADIVRSVKVSRAVVAA